jgi:low temperature requirement protein LtrA
VRFAAGITIVQVLWVARLLTHDVIQFWSFFALVAAELAVPIWAEHRRRTPWHPHHIAERFGLFTLILLGESLLASANAMIDALSAGEHVGELVWLAASGVGITAAIWWIYFARDPAHRLRTPRDGFTFGYLHYVVFAAVGAVSAGVEVEIDELSGHAHVSGAIAGLALTLPLAIFLVAVWQVLLRPAVSRGVSAVVLAAAALIAVSGLLPVGEYTVAAALTIVVVAAVERDAARRR